MTSITEHVAKALEKSFKDRIALAAEKPFSETGVATPNALIWDDYAKAAIRATIEGLSENITPEMVAAGWGALKRAHLPKLGTGPGVPEAFRAMLAASHHTLTDRREGE